MTKEQAAPDSGVITIRYTTLKIGFCILFFLIIVVLIIDVVLKTNIKFADYISIAAFGSITIGLVYTAISLQYTYSLDQQKLIKETLLLKQNLKMLTYTKLEQWNSPEMQHNFELFRRFFEPFKGKLDHNTLREFKEKLALNFNEEKSLNIILNYFEILGLQTYENVIDEETLKKSMRSLITSFYFNLKVYLEDIQNRGGGSHSKIYEQFVNLAIRWQKE